MNMGVPDPTKEMVNKKGIRLDGRKVNEFVAFASS